MTTPTEGRWPHRRRLVSPGAQQLVWTTLALAVVATLAPALALATSPSDQIRAHVASHELGVELTPALMEQLAWLQENPTFTPEASVRRGGTPPLQREVMRALSRLSCAALLGRQDASAHARFVAPQPAADRLGLADFRRLGAIVGGHGPEVRAAVAATAALATSPTARDRCRREAPAIVLSPDSELSLSQLVDGCPQVLPIWATLDPEVRALMPSAFMPRTHFRHMLFTEGGDDMFAELRRQAAAGALTDARFYSWAGRWVVNIAGFHGDQHGVGSAFLTASTARTIFALLDELEALRRDPGHDPLTGYLRARSDMLALSPRPPLAHLACLLKLASPADGQALQSWWEDQPASHRRQLDEQYARFRADPAPAPTYGPALLNNLRDLRASLPEIASLWLALTSEGQRLADGRRRDGELGAEVPLSYRHLAEASVLTRLLDHWRAAGELPPLSVDAEGQLGAASLD